MKDDARMEFLTYTCADLTAKVQYLVDRMITEDGVFTFPDGDSWPQTEIRDLYDKL